MNKLKFRKFAVILTITCFFTIGCFANAFAYSQTISFAGNSKGFASTSKTVGFSGSTGFESKLVSYTFNAMPSGTMPNSNTEINFRLYKTNHTTKATVATAHSYTDCKKGRWKQGEFFEGINHSATDSFVIASNATNASGLGATVGVQWYYY
ncbi:MAG: hypothetical protein J5778_03235 [Clostridiales bacterium]|nr:hypothetical protein [Clostridiales bacterium]